MDMSVKLNLSYPAIATQDNQPDKPLEVSTAKTSTEFKEPRREELEQAVKNIQEFVQAVKRQLEFSIDDSTGKVVVKVIATQSGEVVRQIPSEAALKLAQSLTNASSLLFDEQA